MATRYRQHCSVSVINILYTLRVLVTLYSCVAVVAFPIPHSLQDGITPGDLDLAKPAANMPSLSCFDKVEKTNCHMLDLASSVERRRSAVERRSQANFIHAEDYSASRQVQKHPKELLDSPLADHTALRYNARSTASGSDSDSDHDVDSSSIIIFSVVGAAVLFLWLLINWNYSRRNPDWTICVFLYMSFCCCICISYDNWPCVRRSKRKRREGSRMSEARPSSPSPPSIPSNLPPPSLARATVEGGGGESQRDVAAQPELPQAQLQPAHEVYQDIAQLVTQEVHAWNSATGEDGEPSTPNSRVSTPPVPRSQSQPPAYSQLYGRSARTRLNRRNSVNGTRTDTDTGDEVNHPSSVREVTNQPRRSYSSAEIIYVNPSRGDGSRGPPAYEEVEVAPPAYF